MIDKKRNKILWLSDHPMVPSGVGLQCKYAIIELLKTQRYQFWCLGGAIKHPSYDPVQVSPETFGENNWIIQPVDGHGNKDLMRKLLIEYKPDVICMTTDPRFFVWVWEMEDEIRKVCPIVYWHVWDNDPTPEFNRTIYEATDYIIPLSLKTYGILQDMKFPADRFSYVPHAEPADIFKPMTEIECIEARAKTFGKFADREFVVMWNNRNARRKMTGDVMESVSLLADKVGRHRVALLMHTAANDQEGQDIHSVAKKLGMEDLLMLSEARISPEQLNIMYNVSDCVINIANNEGFGLGTLEAICAGTPIVVNMTGGLQFQMGDWWCDQTDFSDQKRLDKLAHSRKNTHNWWGVPVYPAARNLVGSQQVPYIYDDRCNNHDVANALLQVFKMGRVARKKLGLQAREWALEKFGMDVMGKGWDEALIKAMENHKQNRGKIGTRTAKI